MSKVILVCGRICCGKTTYAHQLRLKEKAVVLSCDEIMLSLLDERLGESHDVYAARTREYLLRKSLEILQTGIPVILDWGPWPKAGRAELKAYYAEKGIPFELHSIRVDDALWRKRIAARNAAIDAGSCQAYHVDEGLAAKFLSRYQEPCADEVDFWIDA